MFVSSKSIVTLQPNLFRTILELTISTRSVAIYQETRTIGMLLLSHLNSNHEYEAWYEASCWVDGITNSTLPEFCSLLKDSANTVPLTSAELVHAWRKANLPLKSLPTRQLSTLLIRGIKQLKQASTEFGTLISQVVTRCLFSYENPVPLALMILEYVKGDDVDAMPTHIADLVEYANMLAFYHRYTKSMRITIRNQLLETTFRYSSLPNVRQNSKSHPLSKKYYNDHCLALTQQTKHLVLINEDDDTAQWLLSYLSRMLTVVLLVRQTLHRRILIQTQLTLFFYSVFL